MNRGSTVASRRTRTHDKVDFNEAPIHESGKSLTAKHGQATPDRYFNEAPIHESGKCSGSRR